MKAIAKGVDAWLLAIDYDNKVAVGEFELVYIVNQAEYIHVPQAPEYCSQIIIWNGKVVPVVDLSSWFTSREQLDDCKAIAILAYEGAKGEVQYGGLKLIDIPMLESVTNDQFCHLSQQKMKMEKISHSSYMSKNGEVVAILNIPSIFSSALH